jgi:hypothetical protein
VKSVSDTGKGRQLSDCRLAARHPYTVFSTIPTKWHASLDVNGNTMADSTHFCAIGRKKTRGHPMSGTSGLVSQRAAAQRNS